MRKFWKIIKENFPVALAMATTFLSIIYAGMRLIIYVYWMGYFKGLNIDANTMEINYEGNLFQVIFYAIIILLIIYIFGMLDETHRKKNEQLKKQECSKFKKFLLCIGEIIVSCLMIVIANLPLFLVMCVMSHLDITFMNFCVIEVVLFVIEIIMYCAYKLQKNGDDPQCKNWKEKLGIAVLCGCLLNSSILATIYYTGSKQFEDQQEVRVVNEENYIITYSDSEHYVLHRCEIVGNVVRVNRNEQKIIEIEGCNYSIRKIDGIEIVDSLK